jgi:hypothetical protein
MKKSSVSLAGCGVGCDPGVDFSEVLKKLKEIETDSLEKDIDKFPSEVWKEVLDTVEWVGQDSSKLGISRCWHLVDKGSKMVEITITLNEDIGVYVVDGWRNGIRTRFAYPYIDKAKKCAEVIYVKFVVDHCLVLKQSEDAKARAIEEKEAKVQPLPKPEDDLSWFLGRAVKALERIAEHFDQPCKSPNGG